VAEVKANSWAEDLDWTPDSRWLAAADKTPEGPLAVFLVSPETGERRQLTCPPADFEGDTNPAFSPDGRMATFTRQSSGGIGDVYFLRLTPDFRPQGSPWRRTFGNRLTFRCEWLQDGKEIICSSGTWGGSMGLWRMSVAGSGPPRRVAILGEDVRGVALSRPPSGTPLRLVFSRHRCDVDTWRLELPGPWGPGGKRVRLLASTRIDLHAQYSPDGRRIVFPTLRNGNFEIWASGADGANPVQLTSLGAAVTGSPRWSPDSARIVFDSNKEGQFDLYVVSAEGGALSRLTEHPADDAVASWSRDGRWIYFTSNRSGSWQVWKMPSSGGPALQVTRNGGYVAFESPDGRFVYYQKSRGVTSLWRVPANGGKEVQILETTRWLNFAVVEDGIYYQPARQAIEFYSFRRHSTEVVVEPEKALTLGLSVSPDRRFLLYSQLEVDDSDLMLVDDFR
jgi:Tol biopolymer transport system component